MRSLFLIFVAMIAHPKLRSMAENASCILPNSSEKGTCVSSKECEKIYTLADFATPDAFEEIKKRSAACLKSGPSTICCEASATIPPVVVDKESPVIIDKIDATTPAAVKPVDQATDYSSHKNYKFFNFTTCGMDSAADRIANGEDAGLLTQPWAVRLGYMQSMKNKAITYNCGGSLITSRYVLSAGHCILLTRQTKVLHQVRLGEYDEKTDPDCQKNEGTGVNVCAGRYQDILVETAIVHPQYNPPQFPNDIGIIRLKALANLKQNNINTICLPFDPKGRKLGTKYEVIGWGATTNSSAYPVLQKAAVPPFDSLKCEEIFIKSKVKITDGQFCAGGEGLIDSCGGDSGGSLQGPTKTHGEIRMVQYGIVSFGRKYCGVQEKSPGVYTKVSKYLTWILDNMQ